MRALLLTSLVVFAGCQPQEAENITGRLVHVEIVSTYDECTPRRYVGDGGTQFIGTLKDGSLLFTEAQLSVFGPLNDGGTDMISITRHVIPVANNGKGNVGIGEDECGGVLNAWSTDGGSLTLEQYLPGSDECTTGPLWLPISRCTAHRDFVLTDVGTCPLTCLQITAANDAICGC